MYSENETGLSYCRDGLSYRWDTPTSSQVSNGDGVVLEIYLDHYLVCKRFAVQTLLWSLEFVIQINLSSTKPLQFETWLDVKVSQPNIRTNRLCCSALLWKSLCLLKVKGIFSGLGQIFPPESPLQTMKNAFYFTSKALFFLKIFKF